MGVRGLSSYIKTYFPLLRRVLQWTRYSGQTWGIDCSPLLFRAKADNLSPLTVFARLLVYMRKYNIRPIFVFDGRPPDAKQSVIFQRRTQRDLTKRDIYNLRLRMASLDPTSLEYALLDSEIAELQRGIPEITSSTKNEIKEFLYASGALSLQATGEADDVLAHLARAGHIQAIVSTDMDLLLRNHSAPLIIPETADATVLITISPVDMATAFGIYPEDLPLAGVLMGCDYISADYFRTMEPSYALTLIREQRLPPFTIQMQEAVLILRGEHSTVQWQILLTDKQRAKLNAGDPPKEPDNLYKIFQEQNWPQAWLQMLL